MSAPIALCDTNGMTRERWFECRMHGPKGDIPYTVGGSDVAAIFGVSPWTSPLDLWMIKKGKMDPWEKVNAGQLEMGHFLEPIAAHFYARKTGNTVIDDTMLYQHADHPYALGNFDRRFIRKTDGKPGILECKSCTYYKASEWADGRFPLYYEFQLRFYLAIADVDIGAFSALWGNNPENDMAMPEIERDPAMEDLIFEKLEEWNWSLIHDKPPTLAGVAPKLALESLARVYGPSNPTAPTIEFPSKYESPLRQIAAAQAEISDYRSYIKKKEEEVEALTVRITELMKEHEHGILETTNDKLLIDFVTKRKRQPETKLLKEKFPLAYEQTLKTSESRKIKVTVEAK